MRSEARLLFEGLVEFGQQRLLGLRVANERVEERVERSRRFQVLGHHALRRRPKLLDVGLVDGLDKVEPVGEVAVSVPTPTPALFAMASMEAPAPCSAKTLTSRRDREFAVAAGVGPHGPAVAPIEPLRLWARLLHGHVPCFLRRHLYFSDRRGC